MKLNSSSCKTLSNSSFSALGRAVWDETPSSQALALPKYFPFSALGRAVWDETLWRPRVGARTFRTSFSALGRAVWDETTLSMI